MRQLTILLTVLLLGPVTGTVLGDPPGRPNVLILLTDDQRAGTASALGHPDAITPNLDTLVRRGLTMTSAYCMGANMGAVCRPSRNMILSGRSYFRWSDPIDGGVLRPNAPRRADTLPAVFDAAGYQTYHHGKRGNSAEEIHRQFDHSHYLNDFESRWSMQAGREVVDDAIDFLRRDGSTTEPWLMYLAFATPHDPRAASPEALAQYDADTIDLPDNVLAQHPFDNGAVLVRDEWTCLWPRTPRRLRDQWHDYLATITTIDGHIGRLLTHLRDAGQLDDTIIAFTSDHGLAMGSHGLMGKQSVYEDAMKAPLVIAGPGIDPGRSDQPVYLMDLYPTLARLCGLEVPSTLDGKSFAHLARDASAAGPRDAVMLAYTDVQRSIRKGDWKMIHHPKIGRTDYYNLADDRGEKTAIAQQDVGNRTRQMLRAAIGRVQRSLGDPLSLRFDGAAGPGDWRVPEPTIVPPNQNEQTVRIPLADDQRIIAAAVGLDRTDDSVAAVRLDIEGGGENRSIVLVGSTDVRWMPLLDQVGGRKGLMHFRGGKSDVIERLGFAIQQTGQIHRTPIWGQRGGEPFEPVIDPNAGRVWEVSIELDPAGQFVSAQSNLTSIEPYAD